MTLEQLLLINAILTLPETSLEMECQWRIIAIYALTVYCSIEGGQPYCCGRRGQHGRPLKGDIRPAADLAQPAPDIALSWAITSIKTDKRPTICFLCLGNLVLLIRKRVILYTTLGSLSRHFLRKNVRKLKEWEQINCWMCDVKLEHRQHLQNHTERFHRTVSWRNA